MPFKAYDDQGGVAVAPPPVAAPVGGKFVPVGGVAAPAATQAPTAPAPSGFNQNIPIASPFLGGVPITVNPAQIGNTVKNMGLEGGGAALGQAAGTVFGPVGEAIGGGAGGFLGNVAGQLTSPEPFSWGKALGAIPVNAIPGAPLVNAGAKQLAIQGAKYGAANLAGKNIQSLVDTGVPASIGEDAMAAGAGIASPFLASGLDKGLRADRTVTAAGNDAANLASLNAGKRLGLVLPPAAVAPNPINNTLQSLGGKASVAQEAILRNQPTVDSIVRNTIGVPEGTALSLESLNTARVAPNLVYGDVANMTPASGAILEKFKQATADANEAMGNFRAARDAGSYLPALRQQAQEHYANADTLRDALDKEAATVPHGVATMDNFDAAREKLAQIGLAQQALRKGNGKIDASVFGHAFEDNPERLTGDFKDLGRFQSAFGKYVKDATNTPPSGVDYLKFMGKVGAGAAGYHAGGVPGAMLAGGATMGAEAGARNLVLSPFYQKAMVKPNYGSMLSDIPAQATKYAVNAAGRGGLPDLPQDAPLTPEEFARLQAYQAAQSK